MNFQLYYLNLILKIDMEKMYHPVVHLTSTHYLDIHQQYFYALCHRPGNHHKPYCLVLQQYYLQFLLSSKNLFS